MSRVGVIAKKLGMSAVFDSAGVRTPVTLLLVKDCQVVDIRNKDKNGYTALQVGAFDAQKLKNVSKPLKGIYAKSGLKPKLKMVEFRVEEGAMLDIGTTIDVDHYVPGQLIDVCGISIGKGFAGAMKRHNFKGLRATHGVSVSHRSHGSTGNRQDPGRVFKGKKMAGHMGARRVTLQNLKVVSVDTTEGLLIVAGAVPGAENSYVIVTDAIKRALPYGAPYPAKQLKTESTPSVDVASESTNQEGAGEI